MFAPYASSSLMDKAGFVPIVSTVTGTMRFLYGGTKFALNGSAALVNRIAKKEFQRSDEAAVDGLKAMGRGLVEILPLAACAFLPSLKIYHLHDDLYCIKEFNSFGQSNFSKSTLYEGKIKNGKPVGVGHYAFKSGDSFEGEMVVASSSNVAFEFLTPKPGTNGTLRSIKGTTYQGIWKNPNHFIGKVKYQNGDVYEGEMWNTSINLRNYRRHGKGTFIRADKKVISGTWKDDSLVLNPHKIT